jgi:hypothetical protein
MTRDEIIRMAQEAEDQWVQHGDENDSNRFLEVFAALVAAAEQALAALSSIQVDVKTTPNAYEAQRQAVAALRAALAAPDEVAAAVEAEREACKAIADQYAWSSEAKFIAAKIQERGET